MIRPSFRVFPMTPGQYETSSAGFPEGVRSFGFPSVVAPQVGDVVGIMRDFGTVGYVIESLGPTQVWDHADGWGNPQITFFTGTMRDANRAGLLTQEVLVEMARQWPEGNAHALRMQARRR